MAGGNSGRGLSYQSRSPRASIRFMRVLNSGRADMAVNRPNSVRAKKIISRKKQIPSCWFREKKVRTIFSLMDAMSHAPSRDRPTPRVNLLNRPFSECVFLGEIPGTSPCFKIIGALIHIQLSRLGPGVSKHLSFGRS